MIRSCVLAFVVVSTILTEAFAQDAEDKIAEARRRVVLPPAVTRLDSKVVRAPLVGEKTLPLVNVMLNGKGPYRLLVDTAANVTLLQMRVADELRLPVLRAGDSSKLVALKTLSIANAHFEDLVVGARAWKEDIDGVIGFSVFANCLLTMDFPKQELSLKHGQLPQVNGKDIFRYGLDNRSPTLEVTIGSERMNILVDTGARQALVIPNSIASKIKFTGELGPGPTLSTFERAASRAMLGRLADEFEMGIHKIAGMKVHVLEDVPVLGSDLFKDFVLTFDQKNQRMKIGV